MMEIKYWKEGIECTKNKVPICYQDDKTCDVEMCRYFIQHTELGNCVLRNEREWTMEDIGKVMGISRQRVEQIERKALGKMQNRGKTTL